VDRGLNFFEIAHTVKPPLNRIIIRTHNSVQCCAAGHQLKLAISRRRSQSTRR